MSKHNWGKDGYCLNDCRVHQTDWRKNDNCLDSESLIKEMANSAICVLERETRAKFPVRKEGTTSKFNLKEARKLIYTKLIQELQEEIDRL